jgi:hypothetical protein
MTMLIFLYYVYVVILFFSYTVDDLALSPRVVNMYQ